MTSNHRPIDDRPAHARSNQESETLCALFDGELRGDEARFALKRLGHDVEWRDIVGRWQLYGDALRGQAQGVAASGFADRVALALREEQAQHVALPVKAGGRRAWMGGALAASVAVAALFVTRPFSDDAPSTNSPPRAPQVATAPVAAASSQVATTPARAPVAPISPPSPDRTLGMSAAAAAVAAVEVPRRATERRASRAQSERAASRVGRAVAQPVIATAGIAQTAVADAIAPITSARRPFQPEHVEPASRPWPRAVLPQYSGNGALTASFEASSASSRSFYPFEPQTTMPAAEDTPAPPDSQD